MCEAQSAEAYLAEFAEALCVPDVTAAPEDRPSDIPAMTEHEVILTLPAGALTSQADVVFAGAGWVGVAPPIGHQQRPNWRQKDLPVSEEEQDVLEVRFRAFFPVGLPCVVRRPALCPRAVLQRGNRLRPLKEFQQPPQVSALRRIVDFR